MSGESHPSNPQHEHMADESMVRNLAAQAEALWPQELPIFRSHPLPERPAILDAGCGTGEISSRLARLFPSARVTGVDLIESHLDRARRAYPDLAGRLAFEAADILALPYPEGAFDLTVCRHVVQAVPDPARALAELVRVTRPGGRIHVLAEDYGMITMHPTRYDVDAFWRHAPARFGEATGCDLYVGRHVFGLLRNLPVRDVAMHYLAVDTVRVPRETFARIWEAWRDGYRHAVAEVTGMSLDEATDRFDDMIACIRNPDGFALWLVPVAVGTVAR